MPRAPNVVSGVRSRAVQLFGCTWSGVSKDGKPTSYSSPLGLGASVEAEYLAESSVVLGLNTFVECPLINTTWQRGLMYDVGPPANLTGGVDISGLANKLVLAITHADTPIPFAGVAGGDEVWVRAQPEGKSCSDLLSKGKVSDGYYAIQPIPGGPVFYVYCEQTVEGGGWTRVDFASSLTSAQITEITDATYAQYTQVGLNVASPSFGSQKYYWLPLTAWHQLLGSGGSLRTETSSSGENMWSNDVTVAGASDGFRMRYGSSQSGWKNFYTANGEKFTTHDKDQDSWGDNCASGNGYRGGGFWYSNCYQNAMAHPGPGHVCPWTNNCNSDGDGVDYRKTYVRGVSGDMTALEPRASCKEFFDAGHRTDGYYRIMPGSAGTFTVYCEQTVEGGGWTRVDFASSLTSAQITEITDATYAQYTQVGLNVASPSFGSQKYYWLPLTAWHQLLGSGGSLRTETSSSGENMWSNDVTVAGASDGFRMRYGSSQSGWKNFYTANGEKFTTHDKDQDSWGDNCASGNGYRGGGFWYSNCYQNAMAHPGPGHVCPWTNNCNSDGDGVDYRKTYVRGA